MSKEEIIKILSKIKDTVGENNYKLALAITGHRTGKIKDIIMCSKDGELLLEYIEQLEQQCRKQKEVIDKAGSILKDNFVYDYVRSCDTTDGVGYDEIDTEHFTYRVYEILKGVKE